MSSDDLVHVTVKLPRELVDRLDAECEARVVGRRLVVAKAIESFLDQLLPLEPPT